MDGDSIPKYRLTTKSDFLLSRAAFRAGWKPGGVFELVGDIVKSVGAGAISHTPKWGSNIPNQVDIFAGDIMSIEPQIGNRLEVVANTAESTVRTAICIAAIIGAKIAAEGH